MSGSLCWPVQDNVEGVCVGPGKIMLTHLCFQDKIMLTGVCVGQDKIMLRESVLARTR